MIKDQGLSSFTNESSWSDPSDTKLDLIEPKNPQDGVYFTHLKGTVLSTGMEGVLQIENHREIRNHEESTEFRVRDMGVGGAVVVVVVVSLLGMWYVVS